jgi:Ino eighty subunit 1
MEVDELRTPGGMASETPAKASTARRRKEPPSGANNPLYANKIKHLKKDDGEPLWRKDIQYDFLKAVFDDDHKVFTNSYEPEKDLQSFADLYIDTMARSSKTSKILRDKLLTEHEPAKNMAMVCLLVNLGRMNTTLNCKRI